MQLRTAIAVQSRILSLANFYTFSERVRPKNEVGQRISAARERVRLDLTKCRVWFYDYEGPKTELCIHQGKSIRTGLRRGRTKTEPNEIWYKR